MEKHASTIFLFFTFFLGLGLLLYPTVSDQYNALHQSYAIEAYNESLENASAGLLQSMMEDARAYNQTLVGKGFERYTLSSADEDVYNSLIDPDGYGVMGYIEIPTANIKLSLYHGVSDAVLRNGVGHLPGTALPAGGEDTHCVLSGHRGLPSARLFTDLDRVKVGDLFYLYVLGTTLAYRVDQIRIIDPGDLTELEVVPGKDLCTLLTCTPYGVNTQRLLVRGERVSYSGEVKVSADASILNSLYLLPIMVTPGLLFMLTALLISTGRKKRRKKNQI